MIVLLGIAAYGSRAPRVAASAAVLLASQLSCAVPDVGITQAPVWETHSLLYFHHGVSAGPTLFTREDASIAEERRFEPFGVPIESYRETDAGGVVGEVDFTAIDQNSLAKRTEPATGWSYHGARWMAPETARWLTPDPPVKAPNEKFLLEPWSLHPYQYVNQNPVMYWDPDGQERAMLPSVAAHHVCVARGTCTSSEFTFYHDLVSGKSPAPVPPDQRATPAEREQGFRANLRLMSVVPTTDLMSLMFIGVTLLSAGDEGPLSLDPEALSRGVPGRGVRGVGPSTARGTPKLLPAPKRRGRPNTAPENGPFYVDPRGNAVPTPPGGRITGSPDGRYIQARDAAGNRTGVRIDSGHKPAGHPDPRAQQPHGHVPGVTNPDGTPWLPIIQ